MGTTTTATASAGGGGNDGSSKGLSATHVVVLLAVLLITIGSLVLSLREGDRRRAYEDQQYQEIQNSEPKGETSKDAEPESLKTKRDQLQKEVESMQKTQDSLMGVFSARQWLRGSIEIPMVSIDCEQKHFCHGRGERKSIESS